MPTVPQKVARHNSATEIAASRRLHELLMDLIRATGLLQPDQTVPGHALPSECMSATRRHR